jgi:hypothetical protein
LEQGPHFDENKSLDSASINSSLSIELGKNVRNFFVIERFGPSLATLLAHSDHKIERRDAINLILKVLDALESIH